MLRSFPCPPLRLARALLDRATTAAKTNVATASLVALVATASFVAVATAAAPPAAAATAEIGPDDDLSAALAQLEAGDELLLAPGTYTLTAPVELRSQASAGSPISVRSAQGRDTVVIDGGKPIQLVDAPFWQIEDLTFENTPVRLVSEQADGFEYHARLAGNHFVGQGVLLRNASAVELAGNHFQDVRSMKADVDRHAMHFVGASSDLTVTGNVVENASADSIQAQGQVDDVVVEGNEFRVNRPHPSDDPFCSTGENAIDIKRAQRWTIRDNYFHGFQRVPGCGAFDSTSVGGEAIVIHKHGARDFEILDNRFEDNSVHLLIAGKTCIAGGTDCSGPLLTEGVRVEGNSFRDTDVPGESVGVRVTPGVGVAELEDPVGPIGVSIVGNTFDGIPLVVDVRARTFETNGGPVFATPADVAVIDNLHYGGRLRLAPEADVEEAGNDDVDAPEELQTAGTDASDTTDTTDAIDGATPTTDQPASTRTPSTLATPSTSATSQLAGPPSDGEPGFGWAWIGIFAIAAGTLAAVAVLLRARLLRQREVVD